MDPGILQSVGQASNDFFNDTGIPVSPQATQFMAQVISLIKEDPHPSWTVPRGNFQGLSQAYEAAVPIYLYQIFKQINHDKGITAFDVVHWLATSFDQYICVIKK